MVASNQMRATLIPVQQWIWMVRLRIPFAILPRLRRELLGRLRRRCVRRAEIYGCTDANACNYFEDATDEDGSACTTTPLEIAVENACLMRIWTVLDDIDDCVGGIDECGVCNGAGAVFECGCVNIPSGDCDCQGNRLDALCVVALVLRI